METNAPQQLIQPILTAIMVHRKSGQTHKMKEVSDSEKFSMKLM